MTLVLRGERVTLRALRPDELDLFWRSRGGKLTRERCLERIERSGKLTEGKLDLGIDVDGRLVGDVGARRPREFYPPGVFELGIDIFHPDDRGHGYGQILLSAISRQIVARGEIPFLHVFTSNTSAIALYRRQGMEIRRRLHVTVLQKQV